MNKKCGYVTILGIPNVGKSTLTNRLVGAKISIVSPKVQTTRRRILGVCIQEETQIVIVDTPGIFIPKKRLDRAMVSAAWGASSEANLLIILADAHQRFQDKTEEILDQALEMKIPLFLVFNKIDLIPRDQLLALIQRLSIGRTIDKVFLISASKGDGVEDLCQAIAQKMPEGPWLFPEDQLTDLPLRLIATEMTREKIFLALYQELPYAMTVETESWENFKNGDVKITQIVHVQKDSQKSILLGKNGRQIKWIRETASKDLQEFLGCRVHLFLHVKISPDWADQRHHYTEMGLDFEV